MCGEVRPRLQASLLRYRHAHARAAQYTVLAQVLWLAAPGTRCTAYRVAVKCAGEGKSRNARQRLAPAPRARRLLGSFLVFILMGILGDFAGSSRSVVIAITSAAFIVGACAFIYSKWIEQPGIRLGADAVKKLLDEQINPLYEHSEYKLRWAVRPSGGLVRSRMPRARSAAVWRTSPHMCCHRSVQQMVLDAYRLVRSGLVCCVLPRLTRSPCAAAQHRTHFREYAHDERCTGCALNSLAASHLPLCGRAPWPLCVTLPLTFSPPVFRHHPCPA